LFWISSRSAWRKAISASWRSRCATLLHGPTKTLPLSAATPADFLSAATPPAAIFVCGQALVTDWQKEFGWPADFIKGGLCMSGLYDMKPARLSKRSSYIKFTDDMEAAMSTQRQIEKLRAPIIVTYGTFETLEFQRQSREFAALVKAAGKPVELIEAPNYNHFEMCEALADPYGPKVGQRYV